MRRTQRPTATHPSTRYFPEVMPRHPDSLIRLAARVFAHSWDGDARIVHSLPNELRSILIDELRKCGRLSNDALVLLCTYADGSPCLPRTLKLRNCLWLNDDTLRAIGKLVAIDTTSSLCELDIRGSHCVTVGTIYDQFDVQLPRKLAGKVPRARSQELIANPLVRVRMLPPALLFAHEALRMLRSLPMTATPEEVIQVLQRELQPAIKLQHRSEQRFSVADGVHALDNRFGFTEEKWEEAPPDDLGAYSDSCAKLQAWPTSDPPALRLCSVVDVTDFVADVRVLRAISAAGPCTCVCVFFFFFFDMM